ncbi:MAG: transposase, partial [Calothrix sp. MO_192.B10]|nr:transposase [Calothrix sp. MO_192.B10]
MARSKTPSFITEIPLKVNSQQERELLARFQAARQLYNACLNEAMVRMEQCRKSQPYQQAKKLNRKKDKTKRKKLFQEAREQARYTEYSLQSFATFTANNSKWMSDKLDAHVKQTIGTRAFKASEKVIFGRAKKARFKVTSRFKSVEGKSNQTGLRFIDNKVVWRKLALQPIIDWANPVIAHGLNYRVKYCRLIWRFIGQKIRWYVQLVNEGLPYQKPQNYVADGVVGMDLNISNIAFVANNKAGLLPFADKVPAYEKEITSLQRKLDRSKRIHNPNNYEPDTYARVGNKIFLKKGKNKKSTKKNKIKWVNTKTYSKNRRKLANLNRIKTSYAKSQNRKLVNEILRHGNDIKTENVSVKGWQKRYGKAISQKSPG